MKRFSGWITITLPFFFFCLLILLSKPLHNSEAEDINLLLYLLHLCPLDLVGGSGLKHWTQWMDLQRTKGSSGLMAPRAVANVTLHVEVHLGCRSNHTDLSTWLGFLMTWQLSSARECPKNKSSKTLRLLMSQSWELYCLSHHILLVKAPQAQKSFRKMKQTLSSNRSVAFNCGLI